MCKYLFLATRFKKHYYSLSKEFFDGKIQRHWGRKPLELVQQQFAMAATPCLKDFFDDEILNAIETEKCIEPVQQLKDFFLTTKYSTPLRQKNVLNQCNNCSQWLLFRSWRQKKNLNQKRCRWNCQFVNQKILLAWMTMNLNCLWKSGCCTGSIRFSVSMALSISSSKKSFGCCTGSIRFSVSMALSISSSKKSLRQGIGKIEGEKM